MTKIRFTFFDIEGEPLQNMEFTLLLNRASFNEEDTGVILPESLVVTTDELGQAIVDLWPLKAAYKIRIAEEYEEVCGKLNWSFYVPQSDEIVDAQHLFLVPPPRNIPWDEEAIGKINQAVIDTHNDAVAAEQFAQRAETAAVQAEEAIDTVAESARQAKLSEEAAALSATSAGDSSAAALTARNEAEGFRDQARTSELAAGLSATTATEQAGLATQEKLQAQEYAEQSEASAGDSNVARVASVAASEASAASATQADAAAVLTAQDKQATASDVVTVTGLKTEVTDLKDETKVYRDEALAAVGTITGAFVDGGLVDLSGGAYPTKPDVSTIWKVSVGGTVTTAKEGTITYATGDQLVYTKTQDTWYKNVSQSAVTKVAGKTGDVELDKADVGLPLVDNTSDADKPISTAQQAAFDARTPTTSRVDTTAGRLVKVGDYGENGGAAMLKSAADDANDITVPGTYVFNGGGLNLPENTVYIKHFNHATAGYSKQIAYSLQTNKVYVRTLNNGVWTDWGPAVEIVDSLTSSDPAKALSARQGKILLELLQANNSTLIRYTFNVAAGQTVITGNSLEGIPLSYVPGVPFMVEKDGFPIWLGNDYTASNGSSITLVEASTVPAQVAITVFGAFSVADHYTKGQTDVLLQNVAAQSAEALLTIKWVPSRQMVGLGTVPLDGGTYSRTTYPDAWALIRDGKVPKTTEALWASDLTARASFTEGDGSTTFRVPDYNGKSANSYQALFLRGDGNNTAAAGVIQRDALQSHGHAINIKASTGAASTYGSAAYGAGQTSQYGTEGPLTGAGVREAVETRPINVAGVWTIRLFGSTSNVGNIDVAQLAAQLATLQNTVNDYQMLEAEEKGFIQGLQLVWNSAKDITIRAGSAYVPSVGKRVAFAGGNIIPAGVVDVNSFIHIYLSAAGTIFQTITAPERYYNNGWRLTGDGSYRYLGSILINTNAIGAYKFRHDLTTNKMWYTHGAPETAPFRLMNGLAGPTVGAMQTRSVTPVTAHTLIGAFRNNGSASINWTPSDAGTSVNTGWIVFNLANTMYSAEMPLSSVDGSITYSILTGAAGYCYATGYIFDR